jgi:tetratricopeptide (TPR) repeat protein
VDGGPDGRRGREARRPVVPSSGPGLPGHHERPPRIFMSYRRSDTSGFAGRLYEDLSHHFGSQRIFRDIENIEPGVDFASAVQDAVRESGVLLVLIGRDWLNCADSAGRRRLDDPDDLVRLEVAGALGIELAIIPVLVEKARIPVVEELPEPLADLVRHNTIELDEVRWSSDVSRLIARLEALVGPPVAEPLPRRGWLSSLAGGPRLTRARAMTLSVLTLVATFLTLYWGVVPFFERKPGPRPMTGDLNIAVAQFAGVDARGRPVDSPEARSLSQSFHDQLGADLDSIRQNGFDVQLRGPDATGPLPGSTPEQRAVAASATARRIDATVIIYGTLDVSVPGQFTPEFYVSERKLEGAEEFLGQHSLGSAVNVLHDITSNGVARKVVRDQLLGRTGALAEFVVGLGYSTLDDWALAGEHFRKADRGDWPEGDGKEILYLFLGNAAVKTGDLNAATTWFDRALALSPDYSRARVGRAETLLQRSRGDCEAEKTDGVGLAAALDGFESALSARVQSPLADISTKVAFGKGRVYLCMSQALLADRWIDAEQSFRQVVADFSRGNPRVRRMASESHAGLGFVLLPAVGDADLADHYRGAAVEYQRAVETFPDTDTEHRKAYFWSMLGFVRERLGETTSAEDAYDQAIRLTRDDPVARERYEAARAAVRRPS